MELTKTFSQLVDTETGPASEADLDIKVEYDEKEKVVTQVISVSSYNHRFPCVTDLTAIFNEHLNLDKLIDSINWPEVYAEEMASRREVEPIEEA